MKQMIVLDGAHQVIHWQSLWLVIAAFVAGVLNAVAGGGSFLSFPALLGTGMLPVHANATNTVALWPGQLTSVAGYREEMRKHLQLALQMGMAGALGGTAGALVLLHTPQRTFMTLVPWLLLIAATIFAASRPVLRWIERRREHAVPGRRHPHRRLVFLFTIVVCFYVGYFGAGAGFVIITVLSLFGFEDLNEINALKVVATTMANGVAFIIFVVGRQVEWRYCLLAMVACAIGGYTSARFARMAPQAVLRWLVIVIGFGMSAWFFWRR